MKLDFVRFNASDDVELEGWLNDEGGEVAVVHVHGMSGNGYENYFLDELRQMYIKHQISVFTIDTRGRGIKSDSRQGHGWKKGGSCFEIFEESIHDIQGAIDYLKSQGKTKFILQGHSLGCTKLVNFVLSVQSTEIIKIVLLAPTDMAGWANTDPNHSEYLSKAKTLLAEGKGTELVDAQCWLDKTPISAQTYPTICEAGSQADIYSEREGGPLLGRVELPMLITYGSKDTGITRIDGSFEKWQVRVDKFKNPNTEIEVIDDAGHDYRNHEQALSEVVAKFVRAK